MEVLTKLAKPVFRKSNNEVLFNALRKEVNSVLAQSSNSIHYYSKIKAILFPLLYFTAWFVAILYGKQPGILFIMYAFMGFMLVVNYLTLIHEAVHGTIFKYSKLNKYYLYLFDLMGANSFIFKIRHVRLHHNYPNVMGWDSDFEQSPLARVFPNGSYHKWHRYQHIYLPFLYPLYLLNWLLIRDFKDYFNKNKLVWKVVSIPFVEYIKLFFFKIFFLSYIIVIPKYFIGISWMTILFAFLIMMFVASIISLIVLLPPHAGMYNAFPLPAINGEMPSDWLLHQLSCTNDVLEDNWFIRFFMGSFNYHIAHHLFPNIHHVYYPAITRVIETFANAHQLPYRKIKLWQALYAHFQLLKNNAYHENIFEESM